MELSLWSPYEKVLFRPQNWRGAGRGVRDRGRNEVKEGAAAARPTRKDMSGGPYLGLVVQRKQNNFSKIAT
jgi:hypothetical protein